MSPQFKKRTHRAKTRLEMASRSFRWMFDACEKARIQGVTWSNHIFCATDAVESLAVEELEKGGVIKQFLSLSVNEQITMFAAGFLWASWRMTQGIYRFDDAIYQAVITTEKNDKIPVSILRRLPEWCVYVETPGLTCNFGNGQTELHGFWACFVINANRELLMIYADVDGSKFDEIMPPTVHIDTNSETLEAGIKMVMSETQLPDDHLTQQLEEWLRPVINLLLYICSDSEITKKGQIVEPINPAAKKTKKGWRLFQAKGTSHWDVGVRMGAAIRLAQTAQSQADQETGQKVRAHVRRAHWHTFLSGKRIDEHGNEIPKENRKKELKWMPPIPINIDDFENLPAVIKQIKK